MLTIGFILKNNNFDDYIWQCTAAICRSCCQNDKCFWLLLLHMYMADNYRKYDVIDYIVTNKINIIYELSQIGAHSIKLCLCLQ